MLISIIVPVYNAEDKIENTIRSILKQNVDEYELIIVNDGSTDKSGDICARFAEVNDKVKVIHQKNSGPSMARNNGISESVGEYITFVDADDIVDPNWLSLLVDSVNKYEPDIIITGYKEHRIKDGGEQQYKRIIPYSEYIEGNQLVISKTTDLINASLFNPLWNKLYKSKLIKMNNIKFNSLYNLGEDFLFNLDYIQLAKGAYIMGEDPYNYLINQGSLTHRFKRDKFIALKGVTLQFKDFLLNHNSSLDPYYQRLIRNCFSSIMELFHKDCYFSFEDKITEIRKIKEDNDVQQMLTHYKPGTKEQILLLLVLKGNVYFTFLISKLFYFKKFIIDKK